MMDDKSEIERYFEKLGISRSIIEEKKLSLWMPPDELVEIKGKEADRCYLLDPNAAKAWFDMQESAEKDGVQLYVISTYRSISYQADIIKRKLERGQEIKEILKVSAPPGYSEHHSGRAIDVGTSGYTDLEVDFESSGAFEWLSRHAANFNFSLSFPRNNVHGYSYEPWHWLFS
ncbi:MULTISPECIES: M15 family metallopeptidase [Pseudomonas syringae group]|uniref:M15 family metallopeptidase n=1 Tax=Pseudomonas syringae group TaxID=136849 RepID=UPI0003122C74|nr:MULTISPECIES: M15 family metallopeptidase [Pseudomonas syringae group]UZS66452.1 D-alanyl-D-alanine carboxypeptidase family protein [Pseudomonas syringae]